MPQNKRILVAPVNWGLGHATRCIPIINKLLEKGCDIITASSERPYHLLKQEFPQLTHLYFPGYVVDYPEGENMAVTILKKTPEMFFETQKENAALRRLIWEHNIKGVISDNRFGLYSRLVPTVYLAHQLNLQMTPGFGWLKPFADLTNLSYARKFGRLWIPDYAGEENFSGELSHFTGLPSHARYVGPLSRFAGMKAEKNSEGFELLITLSGPEPQRTILEEKLTEQAKQLPYKTLMVVGKTEDGTDRVEVAPNVFKTGHLPTNEMLNIMQSVKYIVCRSGYSTVMDLATLGLKAAFIPTPGQPEQEYLATRLKQQGVANFMHQYNIDLELLLADYNNYKGFIAAANNNLLDEAVDEFVSIL